jgi:hypothetical protein
MEARWLKGAMVGSTPQSAALSVPAPQRIASQLPILVKQFIMSLRTPGETDLGSRALGQWSQGRAGQTVGTIADSGNSRVSGSAGLRWTSSGRSCRDRRLLSSWLHLR